MRYDADRRSENFGNVDEISFEALVRGPALYTPAEVARLLRVHPRTILNWVHDQRLDAIRLSERVYRIPRAALVKHLFPARVTRRSIGRRGRVPAPGIGERLTRRSRTKVPA